MDIEKYSFANITKIWKQMPSDVLGTSPFKLTILEREFGKQS